jgi:hypothetical protein
MGFLDKLLGRKKDDSSEGMQTAPEPPAMPGGEAPHEHAHGEGEHAHEREEESGESSS